ncbi:DeoR family transcriptional regulator [Azospirillum halopraeferens]|uniref:DeoR family transcriptional regulator n=1 Tax=Azospirillum halopraeferens TaxID=34010 RepID=UPI0003F4E786|nr:DeoR family transcriptional regulator [Azospirillum halopraeferens]
MDSTLRQQQIVSLVRERRVLQVQWLADHFGVTPQTIRRDIDELSSQSLVRRFRGGVTLPSSVENVAYTTRQMLMADEKRRIARLAAEHVPDDASLFVNIGTTTEAVAHALLSHQGLRVITNNLNVANILHTNTAFSVSIAGGAVRQRDGGIVGEATVAFIRQFKVDIGIIGISGIDEEGDLLDYDYDEVRVARAIIENARRVFLVTDHTKFGRSAMIRLGHIGEIDDLFTDVPPPPGMAEVVAASGCRVHVAEGG